MVATYNEIENLPDLVEAIEQQLPAADVLVIDDGSPDGTGEWCDSRAEQDARLTCIHREGKQGLGSATVLGMKVAIEQRYDILITMDADFSHHPEHLPELLGPLGINNHDKAVRTKTNVDVVIGSRYVAGGQISGWPWRRKWMSRWMNRYARLTMGLATRDNTGAFRAYRVDVLRRMDPDRVESAGYAYLEEVLCRLKHLGATFAEVPIHFRDRTRGETKINWKEAITALRTIPQLGWKLGREARKSS